MPIVFESMRDESFERKALWKYSLIVDWAFKKCSKLSQNKVLKYNPHNQGIRFTVKEKRREEELQEFQTISC